jgi:hypothetical protein
MIVCPSMKPVGEPDAVNPPVRFDEREVETEHGMRILRHETGKPRNRVCRSLPHRATSRLYPGPMIDGHSAASFAYRAS